MSIRCLTLTFMTQCAQSRKYTLVFVHEVRGVRAQGQMRARVDYRGRGDCGPPAECPVHEIAQVLPNLHKRASLVHSVMPQNCPLLYQVLQLENSGIPKLSGWPSHEPGEPGSRKKGDSGDQSFGAGTGLKHALGAPRHDASRDEFARIQPPSQDPSNSAAATKALCISLAWLLHGFLGAAVRSHATPVNVCHAVLSTDVGRR